MSYKTIGLAGTISRIGTTTQALQFVRFLSEVKSFACYIEMNDHSYVEKALELYSGAVKQKSGAISFMDMDLYTKETAMAAQKKTYDYLVKDYGSLTDSSFQRVSFLEQNIKILVCGSKPNEIFTLEERLKDRAFDDAFFIFSLSPEEDKESVLEMMEERQKRTFFASIQTDPFSMIVPNPIYGDLLSVAFEGGGH